MSELQRNSFVLNGMKRLDRLSVYGYRAGRICRGLGHQIVLIIVIGFLMLPPMVWANPQGGEVVAGSASFSGGAGTLTITTSDRVIINWQDFSIGAGELTRFIQPSSTSAALNRVVSGNPSSILGTLQANGQIYLINPNGILVGAGAQINTASFIASTLDVNNAEFLAGGDLHFTGNSEASAQNLGTIHAAGGDVFLVAKHVKNSGTIHAPDGVVGMAAGNDVILRSSGNERLAVKLSAGNGTRDGVGVDNKGVIEAAQAELKANGNVYALAINHGGTVRALGAVNRDGRVILTGGGGDIQASGIIEAKNQDGSGGKITVDAGQSSDASTPATTIVSGTLDASSAAGAGQAGGSVDVLGENVGLFDHAALDVTSDKGGGSVRVGGDFHGANPEVQNAQKVFVSDGSTILADAREQGDGGTVAIWADGWTEYDGTISATGGSLGGNGGSVEVSGKDSLLYNGLTDLSATAGQLGTLLLDPSNITISGADLNTIASGGNPNTFTGTMAAGTIDAATLVTALGSANVIVSTASASASLGTITVSNPITWATANNLTLTSNNSTTISAAITGSGGGSLTLNAGTTLAIGGAITLSGGTSNLSITSNGAVTQTQALSVVGTTTINSGAAGSAVTLNSANDFGGALSVTTVGAGGNISVTDANALVLGTISMANVASTLTLTSDGAITQSGATTITSGTGLVTINSGATGSPVTLTNNNDFRGAVGVTTTAAAGNVAITDANTLVLGTIAMGNAGSTLTVNSTGAITQSGVLTITSGTGTVSFNSGAVGAAITLSNNNDFRGAVSLTNVGAFNLAVTDANALSLGTISMANAANTLTLTTGAGGAITQNGGMTVNQLTITSGGAITLNNAANLITSLGAISRGGDLDIRDSAGGLTIGGTITAGTINNNVTIATLGGDLTLSANISNTGAGNQVILATDKNFINTAGAGAISAAGGARYLVYSTAPGLDTTGGLPFTFQQFSTIFPAAPSAGNTGNGFLYSSAAPIIPDTTQSTVNALLAQFKEKDDLYSRYQKLERSDFNSPIVLSYLPQHSDFLLVTDETGVGQDGLQTIHSSSYEVFGNDPLLLMKRKFLLR